MKYIIGAYSQLPYSSSAEEYEALFSTQIKPLFTMLYKNGDYKLLLRLSPSEIEYFEIKHPEINMLLSELARKEQIELLTSGFHDVVLPLIPVHERSSQIEKNTTFLRKRFGKRPRGLWCNWQVFNPSIVSAMGVSGLDYIVISTQSNGQSSSQCQEPFIMDEMGKSTVVFPTDNRYSKEIQKYYSSENKNLKELLDSLSRLSLQQSRTKLQTIMLNLDQMVSIKDSSELFSMLYRNLGNGSTTPYNYFLNNEIENTFYLNSGCYGDDFDIGKSGSINQFIVENPALVKTYGTLNFLREAIRETKKNTDERKQMEALFMKACSGSLYIPGNHNIPRIRRNSTRFICEIESMLMQAGSLPLETDLNSDRNVEYVVEGKSSICYLDTKGAVINRLNILGANEDLVIHNGRGLFSDRLKERNRVTDLSTKVWEVTPLDKRRLDFFAKCPAVELEKSSLNVTKRFKFRQSTIVVEVEFENLGNNPIRDFLYENTISLCLPKAPEESSREQNVQSLIFMDGDGSYQISLALSDNVPVQIENVNTKAPTCLGIDSYYDYTCIKIEKKLSLGPSEEDHLTIGLRIEKHKEK